MNAKLITLVGLTAALAATASAATLSFEGSNADKSRNVSIDYNGNTKTVAAGALKFRLDGGDVFEAYCIDLDNWISNGDTYEVNVSNTTILPQNGGIVESIFSQFFLGVDSKDKGAALQLALWDAVVDGGDGIAAGNFKANTNATIENLVNGIQSVQNAPESANFQFTYFEAVTHTQGNNNNKFQNVMTGEAVPEPATLTLMAGLGLAALRRRQKAKA